MRASISITVKDAERGREVASLEPVIEQMLSSILRIKKIASLSSLNRGITDL